MSSAPGKLLILVGPAGAGKTTLARAFIAGEPSKRAFSVSHTTRPMRATEQDGRDYWFVGRGEFEALRDQDGFAEWAEVHGNYYGTSRREIARLSGPGQVAVFDIDIVGAHNLWKQYPDQSVLVFVMPPSWAVLVQRLSDRGRETEATLRRRLRTARLELQELLASPAPWQAVLNLNLADASLALESAVAQSSAPGLGDEIRSAVQQMLGAAMADSRAADPT
jgi:guanylate kinase